VKGCQSPTPWGPWWKATQEPSNLPPVNSRKKRKKKKKKKEGGGGLTKRFVLRSHGAEILLRAWYRVHAHPGISTVKKKKGGNKVVGISHDI